MADQQFKGRTYPSWAALTPFGITLYNAFTSKANHTPAQKPESEPSNGFYHYKSGFGSGRLTVINPAAADVLHLEETLLSEHYRDYALIGFQDPARVFVPDTIFIADKKKQDLTKLISSHEPLKVQVFARRNRGTDMDNAFLIQKSGEVRAFYERIFYPDHAPQRPAHGLE